jgi:hypothetical protein
LNVLQRAVLGPEVERSQHGRNYREQLGWRRQVQLSLAIANRFGVIFHLEPELGGISLDTYGFRLNPADSKWEAVTRIR